MKIVIIEDEPLAAQRINKLVLKVIPEAEIVHQIDSVEEGKAWFASDQQYDLILADIQLGDGLSLEIFRAFAPKKPIIFTTAYNQFALDAFRHLSIAYLLKPVTEENLHHALEKLKELKQASHEGQNLQALLEKFSRSQPDYPKRLVIKFGQHIKAIPFDDIACFFVEERICMLMTFDKRQLPADHNLEQLENIVDPRQFFRINRKVMVNVNAIKSMQAYSRSRVALQLDPNCNTDLIVSTERSANFKKWLEG
ncbi:MAG: LytR/AlgR family response regulator transcription factor [Bacteroidia bacterium]